MAACLLHQGRNCFHLCFFFLGVCVHHVHGEIPASVRAEINTAVSGWASVKLLGNEAYNPHAEVNPAAWRAG